ncbi:hypothetical protein CKO42_08880 [Lamprobacter modestohalophilus]|uniref:Uncharacterized protein n=1 Tax=Lamprobacter modestohalophilus TaxID=1064514 RepID=A0A9X0W7T6_9GAMM|nr:hypothetical protein [Lamprobacter modestohalophilus]
MGIIGLLVVLLVSSMALFERLAEVVCPLLEIPTTAGIWLLFLAYLGYLMALTHLLRRWAPRTRKWPAKTVFLGLWLSLTLIFLAVYPLADSGVLGFESDREEALDVGVKALWNGTFPYQCRAVSGIHEGCPQSGNPIAPMPGGLILAAPVVLILGSAAALSLLSLWVLFLGLGVYWGSNRRSLLHVMFLLAAAPVLLAEVLTGGDHLANTVLVCIPLLLLTQNAARPHAKALALLFGCALAWRGLFWLVSVPILSYCIHTRQWQPLALIGGYALAGFAAVMLPFALWDPTGFAPWSVQQRFQLYEHILPHAALAVPACVVALGACFGWLAKDQDGLLNACGWTLLLPVIAGAVLQSITVGQPTVLFYGWYSLTSIILFSATAFRGRKSALDTTQNPAYSRRNERR